MVWKRRMNSLRMVGHSMCDVLGIPANCPPRGAVVLSGAEKNRLQGETLDAVPPLRRHLPPLLVFSLVLLAACGGPYPQSTLAPVSDFGHDVDKLFTGIFWWAVGVFIVVEGLLLYSIVRFRHREGGPAPKQHEGHTALEIAWTLAPALILVFIAVPTVRTIFKTAGTPPPGALRVEVIGHQWWWEYRYPDLGIVTANELHLPVGKPVAVDITSADVIH